MLRKACCRVQMINVAWLHMSLLFKIYSTSGQGAWVAKLHVWFLARNQARQQNNLMNVYTSFCQGLWSPSSNFYIKRWMCCYEMLHAAFFLSCALPQNPTTAYPSPKIDQIGSKMKNGSSIARFGGYCCDDAARSQINRQGLAWFGIFNSSIHVYWYHLRGTQMKAGDHLQWTILIYHNLPTYPACSYLLSVHVSI